MAVTRIIPVISLTATLDYLYDEKAPSHRTYLIERDREGAPSAYADLIGQNLALTNLSQEPRHQIETPAQWIIVAFDQGANLSSCERQGFTERLRHSLQHAERWAWHVHRINGAADLNLILPTVVADPYPRLLRFAGNSLWARTKADVDTGIRSINATRRAQGIEELPPQPGDVALRLTQDLAVAAREAKSPISLSTLRALLDTAGYSDWLVDDDELIHRRKRQRIRLPSLFKDVRMMMSASSKLLIPGPHLPNHENVETPRRPSAPQEIPL